MNIVCQDQRQGERFAWQIPVEIMAIGRRGACARGNLVDCSNGGIGFFAAREFKPHTVIVLRIDAPFDGRQAISRPAGVAPFYTLSAVVRWCRRENSPNGQTGYRIGVARLLPAH
jgi:hypothetical protein